jgi:hypothetical protein
MLGWTLAPFAAGAVMQRVSLVVPLVIGAALKIAYDALLDDRVAYGAPSRSLRVGIAFPELDDRAPHERWSAGQREVSAMLTRGPCVPIEWATRSHRTGIAGIARRQRMSYEAPSLAWNVNHAMPLHRPVDAYARPCDGLCDRLPREAREPCDAHSWATRCLRVGHAKPSNHPYEALPQASPCLRATLARPSRRHRDAFMEPTMAITRPMRGFVVRMAMPSRGPRDA